MADHLYKLLLDFTEFSEVTLGVLGTCPELVRQEAGPPLKPVQSILRTPSCSAQTGSSELQLARADRALNIRWMWNATADSINLTLWGLRSSRPHSRAKHIQFVCPSKNLF